MNTFRQFDPLVVKDYVTDVFLFAPHGHTYYELVYIFKGNGNHLLNNNQVSYHAGDLFLISPDDYHHFEVKQSTRFIVIKFTEDYFNTSGLRGKGMDSMPQVVMRMQALKETKLVFNAPSALSLKSTVLNIASYKDFNNIGSSSHVYFQLLSVFGLIQEVLVTPNNLMSIGKRDNQQLISYLHQYIYDPEKCKIRNIAHHFNISATYFGDYFKKIYGISYRDYLNQYRIKLIEKRIESGSLNMKQIAEEFGFSDESHFSNYFKKQRKLRPVNFKRENLNHTSEGA
jgi:AraC-like DNA-binding protein